MTDMTPIPFMEGEDGKLMFPVDCITVERKRYRNPDDKDIAKLAHSIETFGQLQPIIIELNGELIDGGRRLAAHQALKRDAIWGIYRRDVDELLAKTLELEANIQRLDMDWRQRAEALAELHKLRKELNPKWSQQQTAEEAGVGEQARVSEALQITQMMKLFPELKDAKSLRQAQSWAESRAAGVVRLREVRHNPADFADIEKKIWLGDSRELIKQVPSGSFRAIVTDPPFGIDYDQRKAGTEQSVTAYKDDEEYYESLLAMAPDLFRVLKDDGFLVWFLGPTWYERAKLAFRAAGFTVDEIPLIWHRKGGRAYTTRPDRYFGRLYDMALHCIKGDPQMVVRSREDGNVFVYKPIEGKERDLLVERPIELYAELIRCLTHPGETVADFFVGGGGCPAAAAELKRDFFGIEKSAERRAVALKKVRAHLPETDGEERS